jgi:hypothetical protein
MELTPRQKKVNILVEIGKYAGIATMCMAVVGGVTLKAQNLVVLPVVKTEVDKAKVECRQEISKTHEALTAALEKQAETNRAMMEYLHRLDVTTTELKTEARIMNRKRRED